MTNLKQITETQAYSTMCFHDEEFSILDRFPIKQWCLLMWYFCDKCHLAADNATWGILETNSPLIDFNQPNNHD